MTDCFDIVPVRVEYESCVIVRVVMGTQSRCAIVTATCFKCPLMKSVHVDPPVRDERYMQACMG